MTTEVTLYRADPRPGLTRIWGERSWTSSRRYAERYRNGFYGPKFGGPHLYRAAVPVDRAVDLRKPAAHREVAAALADVMDILGIDSPADIAAHNLYREAAGLVRSLGWEWLVFKEYEFDEWLYLGRRHIKVVSA